MFKCLFQAKRFTHFGNLSLPASLPVVLFVALGWLLLAMPSAAPHSFAAGAAGHLAGRAQQTLSFEDRVAAQRAIEEVYHRHRLWPTDNPQPKPSLEAMIGEDALRGQSARVVEDALRLSTALAVYFSAPVSAADLQAEVDRMARDTRQADVLRELWAALGNDPLRVAECLARPLLVERLVRLRFEECGMRIGECQALGLVDSSNPQSPIRNPQSENPQFDEWWRGVRAQMEMAEAAGGEYRLPEIAAMAASPYTSPRLVAKPYRLIQTVVLT
ncbi:MAG: hypothetical protein HY011_26665 [Acidobacteria bacterium]|nr:hypothetical protein [Acidobacteriota bacterium]